MGEEKRYAEVAKVQRTQRRDGKRGKKGKLVYWAYDWADGMINRGAIRIAGRCKDDDHDA